MQISKKLILALGAALMIFVLGLYITTHMLLLTTFNEVENKRAEANSIRIQKAVDRLASELSSTTNDWAHYDEAYDYLAGKNPNFVKDNINLEGLMALHINAFTYLNDQGIAALNIATNNDFTSFVTLPKEYSETLTFKFLSKKLTQNHSQVLKGLIALPKIIMFIAASEVTNAAVTNTANGILLTGRYFSKELVDKIGDRTSLNVKLHLLPEIKKDPELNAFFEQTMLNPSDTLVTLKANDKKNIYGYVVLRDINQTPIALMEMTSVRSVYAVGFGAINYFISAFIVVGIMLLILIVFLIRTFVVKRILSLNELIACIGKENDYSLRLDVEGSDEISFLTAEFNKMMSIIQDNHQQLLVKVQSLSDSEEKIKNVNVKLTQEIQKRKIEEGRADLFNKKLLTQAHLAGVAEIATSILHNIGNTLNSVKVSVQYIDRDDKKNILTKIQNITQMLILHQDDLSKYLLNDSKGKLIPQYLAGLAQLLIDRNNRDAKEILHLKDLIRHIDEIIAMQKEQSGT